MGKIFFLNFTSASAKSNLANVGGILARIKNFFLQRWFLIGSSIRFRTGVTFEEKLYIITEAYQSTPSCLKVMGGVVVAHVILV